jgi:hypothetical protein
MKTLPRRCDGNQGAELAKQFGQPRPWTILHEIELNFRIEQNI